MSKANKLLELRSLLIPEQPDYCVEIDGRFYEIDNVNLGTRQPIDPDQHGQPRNYHECIKIGGDMVIYF